MITAVIPVRNEAKSIGKVINCLSSASVDIIIPVINGTTDDSLQIIKQIDGGNIFYCYFTEPLGYDIPRAIGATVALKLNSSLSIFIDGDMSGNIKHNIDELIISINKKKLDLALTDCYPNYKPEDISPLAKQILEVRKTLNQQLLLQHIGTASPSHGPHALSGKFLKMMPLHLFAIPPALLAIASKNNLKVGIGTSIPHSVLGSPLKDSTHSTMISETIIGDCAEALQIYLNQPRHRIWNKIEYTGYNQFRRWDILKQFITKKMGCCPFKKP